MWVIEPYIAWVAASEALFWVGMGYFGWVGVGGVVWDIILGG